MAKQLLNMHDGLTLVFVFFSIRNSSLATCMVFCLMLSTLMAGLHFTAFHLQMLMSVVQTPTTATSKLTASTLMGVSCAHVMRDSQEMELCVKVRT